MSGLKQSIVIVSEFTFKTKSGGGSRGATPGAYAYDYMARGDAVEPLPPVKLHAADAADEIYRARERALRESPSVAEMKSAFRSVRESAGAAFGYGYVSLPQDRLVQACDDIQKQFDDGKTVFKTVISFDGDYLKRLGVVQDGPEYVRKGGYRGHVDQMKLRMAVMSGLDRLSGRGFDDLQYVGAIQVDTRHVHCHLAMVDRGEGRVINSKTGAQKGKLSKADFDVVRKGVDAYLAQYVPMKHLSLSSYDDTRNVRCFVKNYAHEAMLSRSMPQFLLACLPEDRGMWRAGNPAQAMRKPNAIVREYVETVLARPDSGYGEAMAGLRERISGTEGLTEDAYRKLYSDGREGIVRDCMNGVYQALRSVPESELRVRTPALSRMSMDFEDMASKVAASSGQDRDGLMEFGFRLRSYAGRQDYHRKEAVKYHNAVAAYEARGNISESARPVIEFMRFEEEYNSMLLSKYQHFMAFLPREDEYEDELREVRARRERVMRLESARDDARFGGMTVVKAEAYGRDRYGLSGCGMLVADSDVFDRRLEMARAEFERAGQELDFGLSMFGMGLFEEDGRIEARKDIKHPFDDVKALDLHHLGFDFGYDIEISKPNYDAFMAVTARRTELFEKAAEYLELSGQSGQIEQFAVGDIRKMRDMADVLGRAGRLPSAIGDYMKSASPVPRNRCTVSLDTDYDEIMSGAIRERVNYQAAGGDML